MNVYCSVQTCIKNESFNIFDILSRLCSIQYCQLSFKNVYTRSSGVHFFIRQAMHFAYLLSS